MLENVARNTAEDEARKACPTARSHDDQVAVRRACRGQDLGRRVTLPAIGFSPEASRLEFTTSGRSSNEVHVRKAGYCGASKPSHCRSIGRPRRPPLSRPVDRA